MLCAAIDIHKQVFKTAVFDVGGVWVPKIPFRLQISQFGLSDQNFGTPQATSPPPSHAPVTDVALSSFPHSATVITRTDRPDAGGRFRSSRSPWPPRRE
jgi:hypothetical protein